MRKPDVGKRERTVSKPLAHAPASHPAKTASHPSKLSSWLKLVRIEHALMSAAGVGVAILLAEKAAGPFTNCLCSPLVADIPILSCDCPTPFVPLFIWLAALAVPLSINIAAFALNDYFDIEADRQNGHKERPLVSGALSPRVAVLTAISGYAIGVLAGWLINPLCGLIGAVFAALSIAYNAKLKDWPLIGNAYIALSMAIAFPFGAAVLGAPLDHLPRAIMWLTLGAFAAGLARELVKSVQDMEGDKKARGSRHLPLLIGAQPTLILAAILCGVYASSIIKFSQRPLSSHPLFFIGLFASATLYLMLALMMLRKPDAERLELIRKASLGALGLALAAVLAAVLL